MKIIYILIFFSISQFSFAQDSLALKGTTYNKFVYKDKILKFNDLSSIVTPKAELLNIYNESVKARKKARIVENMAFVAIGFGIFKLISIPAQSTKFFLLGGAVGVVSIPLKIKSKKKVDDLIIMFNNSRN